MGSSFCAGRPVVALVLGLVILCAAAWWGKGAQATDGERVTVFADDSLSDVLKRLSADYETKTGVKIELGFAASATLAWQIRTGTRADVFITPDDKWVDYLGKKGLIKKGSRKGILTNDLVLIAPKGKGFRVRAEKGFDLAGAFQGRLAIADPARAPAGRCAEQALRYLGWWDGVKDRRAFGADARAALRFVKTGEAAAGIVYATDATSEKVEVLFKFPTESHQPIHYVGVLCKNASPLADVYMIYLQKSEAERPVTSLTLNALRGFVHLLRQGIRCLCMSPQERMALWISAKVAVCCVAVIALPGIVCAWVLARGRFTGKALLDTVVHAPLVIPSVVSGYLALLMLGRHGILGRYLYEAFGISLAFTWKAAVVASAIMAFPLMVRPVRAALEQVDRGIEQAASTLGAGRLRVFVTVTLPLAMPGLVSGLILAFARSLGEFGATITFAANIEGETRTLPLAVYTLIQTPGGDGPAMRLVVISVLLSVGALALSEVMSRRFTRPVGVV